MPIAAAMLVGSSVLGAGVSAYSASKAASAQKKAAQQAQQTAKDTFDKQAALQEPFRQGGLTAQGRIMELLGLKDPNASAAPAGPEAYGLRAVGTPGYGGDGGFGGLGGYGGAPSYVDARGNPVADVNAYMAANPLPAAAPSADFGKYARDFGNADFQADPGYAFRQAEGMKALERSAAARGNLLSGSTLKGIQRFGQDLASQEYSNAFNRYQVNRSNQLNPLQSLMGSGQSATNVVTGAAGQEGQNIATGQMNAGQARASGYIGVGNAISQGIGNIGNYYAEQPLQNAMINYYGAGAPGGVPGGRDFYGRGN